MTHSNSEITPLSSPSGQDSSSRGLLSDLWQWIKSYGGLSDLKKYNANLRKYNEGLRRSNEEFLKLEAEKERLHKLRLEELRRSNEEFLKLEAEKKRLHKLGLEELRKETDSIKLRWIPKVGPELWRGKLRNLGIHQETTW